MILFGWRTVDSCGVEPKIQDKTTVGCAKWNFCSEEELEYACYQYSYFDKPAYWADCSATKYSHVVRILPDYIEVEEGT